MPANGLKYQARPAQKKKAALAARSTCSSFFNRFCRGIRARTPGCASVVARTPATMTIAVLVSARLFSSGTPIMTVYVFVQDGNELRHDPIAAQCSRQASIDEHGRFRLFKRPRKRDAD